MTGRMAGRVGHDRAVVIEKTEYKKWEKDIRGIMKDFCIGKETAEKIISGVKMAYADKPNDVKYSEAHRRFKKVLDERWG